MRETYQKILLRFEFILVIFFLTFSIAYLIDLYTLFGIHYENQTAYFIAFIFMGFLEAIALILYYILFLKYDIIKLGRVIKKIVYQRIRGNT